MVSTHEIGGPQQMDESLGARFEISFDGKRYAFRQHRYDHFDDALRYAVSEHFKDGFLPDDAFQAHWEVPYCPSGLEQELMKLHGVVYVACRFRYGGYRYEKLCDAVAFAVAHPNL
ncbi:hypothetical protein [Pseudoduganella sp. RAF53_2]|uniref:hypothetical protein n=1 Tax=unclassified Pseudoduganella TaxID=2637179 RepID=UPI003F98C2D5